MRRPVEGSRHHLKSKRVVPLCEGHKVPYDGPKYGHVDEVGDLSDEGRVLGLRHSVCIDAKSAGIGHNFESDSVGSTDDDKTDKHQKQLDGETSTGFDVDTVKPHKHRVGTIVDIDDNDCGGLGGLGIIDRALRTQQGSLLVLRHLAVSTARGQTGD